MKRNIAFGSRAMTKLTHREQNTQTPSKRIRWDGTPSILRCA